jgi:hypothetical protein
VPLLIIGGSFSKSSAPPLFLEDENFFQKSASMVVSGTAKELQSWSPIFEKKFSSSRKRRGADFFPGLVGGLYGQNLPYKFKNSYGDL